MNSLLQLLTSVDVYSLLVWYITFEVSTVLVVPYLTSESRSYRKQFALLVMLLLMTYGSIMILCHSAVTLQHDGYESEMHSRIKAGLVFTNVILVKTPAWPYASWLPEAHVEATFTGSVVLAAIVLKYAVQGMLQYNWSHISLQTWVSLVSIVLSTGTMCTLWYVLGTHDMKKLVANCSIVHMCLATHVTILQGSSTGHALVDVLWLAHSIGTSALFLYVGYIYAWSGNRVTSQQSVTSMPVLSILVTVPAWLHESDPAWTVSVASEATVIIHSLQAVTSMIVVYLLVTQLFISLLWVITGITGNVSDHRSNCDSDTVTSVVMAAFIISLPGYQTIV